ncbi:MAG: hypothetical protein ACJ74T_22925 [Pyrinomonadaceae bacterium]
MRLKTVYLILCVLRVALAIAAVGVSLGLPLFLYLRERRLERGV